MLLRKYVFNLAVVLMAFSLGACSRDHDVHEEQAETEGEADAHDVHWGYKGDTAPARWADLDPSFSLCADGAEQSPIDLSGAVPVNDTVLERLIGQTVLAASQRANVMQILDNGHTIQVTSDAQLSIRLGETVYELVQFHFHSPSEHTIAGEHAPLEAHFVHKSEAGELAVLGVLVEEGEHNVALEPVFAALPAGAGDERRLENLNLDMNALRPLPKRYYRYRGSLTTPPCSENVQWIVFTETHEVSAQQMAELVSHLHDNNRPVQPLGERNIGLISID